jgi:hypothetical protein
MEEFRRRWAVTEASAALKRVQAAVRVAQAAGRVTQAAGQVAQAEKGDGKVRNRGNSLDPVCESQRNGTQVDREVGSARVVPRLIRE